MAAVQTSLPQCCSANFTMEKIVEQRVCLKFCVANEISCADALKMLKKARIVARQFVDFTRRQCASAQSHDCGRLQGQKLGQFCRPSTVFAWFGTVRLLSFPETEIATPWYSFFIDWWHQKEFAAGPEGHTRIGLPEVHGRLVSPFSHVHCKRWGLLWRRQNKFWWINKIFCVFFNDSRYFLYRRYV